MTDAERADKAEAAAAEMRAALESLRDYLVLQEQSEEEHDMVALADAALSSSAGKGWVSPEEYQVVKDSADKWFMRYEEAFHEFGAVSDKLGQAQAEAAAAVRALDELVDLVQGVIDGDYTPDSFTLQPAREALNGTAAKALLEELSALRERIHRGEEMNDRQTERLVSLSSENEKLWAVRDAAQWGPTYLPAFLTWIADRLVHVHHEDPHVDYVLSLRERSKRFRAALDAAAAKEKE